jgi:hypothetical protein
VITAVAADPSGAGTFVATVETQQPPTSRRRTRISHL